MEVYSEGKEGEAEGGRVGEGGEREGRREEGRAKEKVRERFLLIIANCRSGTTVAS